LGSDVLLVFKVGGEKLLNNSRLHLRSFGLAQLHQSVTVTRVASAATKLEVDAFISAEASEPIKDHLSSLLSELGNVVGFLVDRLGGVWIQVEWTIPKLVLAQRLRMGTYNQVVVKVSLLPCRLLYAEMPASRRFFPT
jgi:hypothetical protein